MSPRGKPERPRITRHVHNWVWKRRSRPVDGSRPYDEYRCEGPGGCGATEQRPV